MALFAFGYDGRPIQTLSSHHRTMSPTVRSPVTTIAGSSPSRIRSAFRSKSSASRRASVFVAALDACAVHRPRSFLKRRYQVPRFS
ncbi:MAG TPA: hypothetical protein VHO06_15670 [Polyangia bacterium]|nr:hypothetical protein [Polyangia bacterium]